MTCLSNLLQRVNWRLRSSAGLPCRDDVESFYRINRLPAFPLPGTTFRFPWGEIEFVSMSDLRDQFSEIFVERHYAFKSSTAEPVIIDGGGNISMSAIWFKQAYPKCKLTVYEADPTLAAILSRNLAAAAISNVAEQQAAVWESDGTV